MYTYMTCVWRQLGQLSHSLLDTWDNCPIAYWYTWDNCPIAYWCTWDSCPIAHWCAWDSCPIAYWCTLGQLSHSLLVRLEQLSHSLPVHLGQLSHSLHGQSVHYRTIYSPPGSVLLHHHYITVTPLVEGLFHIKSSPYSIHALLPNDVYTSPYTDAEETHDSIK